MKNKKAFTLVEVLAIIIMIGLISLLVFPPILKSIDNTKLKLSNESLKILYSASDLYVKDKLDNFPLKNGNKYCITVKDLIDSGNLLTKVYDAKGNEISPLTKISVNIKNGNYNYYIDNKCIPKNLDEIVKPIEPPKPEETIIPDPVSFETDSWATIQKAVKEGNISKYNIGDTKEVTLGETKSTSTTTAGTYTVRLVNKTMDGCKLETDGFSQTACGFVIEFVDIILEYKMSDEKTNRGGWPESKIFKLLNDETDSIYSVMPEDLKKVIIPTYTVSGRGSTGLKNYTSDDNKNKVRENLYLFSLNEIIGTSPTEFESLTNETKQVQYYKNNNNEKYFLKYKLDGKKTSWWLRTPNFKTDYQFIIFSGTGYWFPNETFVDSGVAPVFRIG